MTEPTREWMRRLAIDSADFCAMALASHAYTGDPWSAEQAAKAAEDALHWWNCYLRSGEERSALEEVL